ncbi:hypothetical protein ACEWY4_021115 [Coilia grayii]|uniref:Interferon-induced protein with tetratricopeptide repeats 1-like n=1 Tax=Coilia grayii TaxID=363190 RepID=A0ABD1J825_9TELE
MRRLEKLECHFTWTLSDKVGRLHQQQEILEMVSKSDCSWKGHLYNLLGYIYYKIGKPAEKALTCLRKAAVILQEQEEQDGRGPRLMVNQANLAWLHCLLDEPAESQHYLEEVARLQEDFPAPPGCELHPEVHGEKGWSQMRFGVDYRKQAISNFEKALIGDPDRKEWHKGLVLAKYRLHCDRGDKAMSEEIFQQIKHAKRINPQDIQISILYLNALADTGRKTEEIVREAHTLAQRLQPPLVDLGSILHFLRVHDSLDSALHVAEELEKKYPSDRDAKKQLALCYKWKIFNPEENVGVGELMRKAIPIYEEVTRLFPHYLRGKIDLAAIYAKSAKTGKADEIYLDLLKEKEDLDPPALLLLYSRYASHLFWCKKSTSESTEYHKKAAEIQIHSKERKNSIRILRSIANNCKHPSCEEIQEFLLNLEQNECCAADLFI